MEKILIITGGSKGIGKGIIDAYQAKKYRIFSISRTRNDDESFNHIDQISFDLSKISTSEMPLQAIFKQLGEKKVERIVLINNAGTLGEIGRLENIDARDIAQTVQLNTVAPLLLTAAFIKLTENWSCEKKIINISSGAAQNPYYGWTVYCATKAALDMMTKTIATEQNTVDNGVGIIAIYPGVVDTEMQAKIRKSNKQDFISIDRFLELKSSGSLANAKAVGEKIFALDQQNLENGSIIRIE